MGLHAAAAAAVATADAAVPAAVATRPTRQAVSEDSTAPAAKSAALSELPVTAWVAASSSVSIAARASAGAARAAPIIATGSALPGLGDDFTDDQRCDGRERRSRCGWLRNRRWRQ